jgi:hypothetical protein
VREFMNNFYNLIINIVIKSGVKLNIFSIVEKKIDLIKISQQNQN